nr:formate dehydrogenase subunit alpha [Methanosarcina sp. KYL-1]
MHPTICPYCSLGCGFFLELEEGKAVGIRYMPEHPVNEGSLCPKGNAAPDILNHPDRLKYPLLKTENGWKQLEWEEALSLAAEKLGTARKENGPNSLAFLGSAKCSNEENYLFQKIARLLGTSNVDNCARLCHASTLIGLGKTLGAGAMTNPLADLSNSDCVFVIGSNFAENHPAVARQVLRAKDKGAFVIVADPRLTPTSWLADLTLRLKPGTDVALLNGMMHVIVNEGLLDRNFVREKTEGFPGLEQALQRCCPETASRITGIPPSEIIKAARAYARAGAASIVYSMGITQHISGTDNVTACADLALLCGQVGRKGAGVLPLRGQNNVQGACDMGALAEFFPGYGKVGDAEAAGRLKTLWKTDKLPEKPGLTATEIAEAAGKGKLKALYVMGEDLVNSHADSSRVREALESLDFLVVQDIFMTDTAEYADLVLPAAAWAEKEGSFTSTERRVQWTDRALSPPGEAKPDIEILLLLAEKLGLGLPYRTAGDVLAEISGAVPSYGGMTKERLKKGFGLIWPCPDSSHPGTPVLHVGRFKTPDGKARLIPVEYQSPAEIPDPDYPFLLTTGRVVLHYNAGSMSRRSKALLEKEPGLFVEIHPSDAKAMEIGEGNRLVLETRRGKTEATARLTGKIGPGVLFMPFHFPGTNVLTGDALDREAKIPEFKVSACRIRRE